MGGRGVCGHYAFVGGDAARKQKEFPEPRLLVLNKPDHILGIVAAGKHPDECGEQDLSQNVFAALATPLVRHCFEKLEKFSISRHGPLPSAARSSPGGL